jgi:hypothetical protein
LLYVALPKPAVHAVSAEKQTSSNRMIALLFAVFGVGGNLPEHREAASKSQSAKNVFGNC